LGNGSKRKKKGGSMSMILGMLIVILPIAIVAFIIIAIVRSVRKDGSEESFQDVIRTTYIYLIMIIFLVMFFTATISLFNSCMSLLLPETVQNTYTSTYTTNNRSIAEVTTNIAILCISIPMFAYYSTLAKKENKNGITKATVKVEVK
jgi:magnesium-transporting ATPase (P-type)